ncbi:uncharacterized protein [Branchiostoma lanceolatum]|uniref:uncharacterized protein n=1 Tax=Branchiostoma lanceolatum TaxID=7740 RepID=UPI003455B101
MMTNRRDRLFKSRVRVAGDVLDREEYDYLKSSGQVYMSDEVSDEDDKSSVWVQPPAWRADKLTDITRRCQPVLDQNRRDRRLPFSNKERKQGEEFTDRCPPSSGLHSHTSWLWPPRKRKARRERNA